MIEFEMDGAAFYAVVAADTLKPEELIFVELFALNSEMQAAAFLSADQDRVLPGHIHPVAPSVGERVSLIQTEVKKKKPFLIPFPGKFLLEYLPPFLVHDGMQHVLAHVHASPQFLAVNTVDHGISFYIVTIVTVIRGGVTVMKAIYPRLLF
jgi:hypothetical protein